MAWITCNNTPGEAGPIIEGCTGRTFTSVIFRTKTPGVLPAVTSYSITPLADSDWALNGVLMTSSRTMCQGVEDCNCLEEGITYNPGAGELLITYIECVDSVSV